MEIGGQGVRGDNFLIAPIYLKDDPVTTEGVRKIGELAKNAESASDREYLQTE